MIAVICSANAPYIPRIRPYLDSLAEHLAGTDIRPILVTVDCDAPAGLPIEAARQDTATLPYAPPLSHLQAGGFLGAVPGDDDDVLIFTDGDIVMQRPPTATEVAWLQLWPEGAVGLGYNVGPGDSLYDEFWRLGPRAVPQPGVVADYARVPCYNTGVAIARRKTWREWFEMTARLWPNIDATFQHYAKQQWCMNLALDMGKVPVIVLPQTIHTHGCYALPHGCHGDDAGRLCYLGTPVLFRHHL